MTSEKISVIIASFNGIRYIGEQLDSIRTQSRTPDEVIICDDCSSDGTFEFCKDYVNRYNLSGWRVFQNEKNLGFAKNFRHAFTLSNFAYGRGGGLVFTCDQDDIWLSDKIQVMSQAMHDNLQIMLLASNYVPFDDKDGKKIQAHVKYINRDDGEIIKFRLQDTWLESLRPGCTYCFRSELLGKFKIFDLEGFPHDGMLWKYAIISDSLYLINRQLIRYRRHDSTTTPILRPHKPANLENRVNGSKWSANLYMTFVNAPEGLGITKQNRELLTSKANFLTRRSKVLGTKNLFAIILFVLMNIKYYPTMRNALSDIYAAIFLRS